MNLTLVICHWGAGHGQAIANDAAKPQPKQVTANGRQLTRIGMNPVEALLVLARIGIDEKPLPPEQRFQRIDSQTPRFDQVVGTAAVRILHLDSVGFS